MSVLTLALVAGCSGGGETLYVSTAASLSGPFAEVEAMYEAEHPGVDVVLNIGGSATLRYQIDEGAPIDVFASADPVSTTGMDQIIFATNSLQIVVPSGNPAGVTGLESLTDDDLLIGACASAVPCGRLADAVLAESNLTPSFDTREGNVKAVLEKVALGELDAGLVYVTDVTPDVETIVVESDLSNAYPVVSVSGNSDADAFVAFVLSPAAQEVLAAWGFGAP